MDNNRMTTEQQQDDEIFIRLQHEIPDRIHSIVEEMLIPDLMDGIAEWSGELAGKYGQSEGTFFTEQIKNEVIKQLKI